MEDVNSHYRPFPTTQWSLVVRAGADSAEVREEALAEICKLYWPPVYAFIRSKRYSPHDAEDLTQAFFAEFLKRNDFAKADEGLGRLRSYLLGAVSHYLSAEFRRENRLKRGGGMTIVSFDSDDGESRCLIPEPVDEVNPEKIFERQWAITVMESVVNQLSARYEDNGQSEIFNALRPWIHTSDAICPQKDVAVKLGMAEQAVRVAIHRLRQRYAETLRDTVRATLGKHENVDDELRHLIAAFQ